jgi:hypothetical protein
MIASPNTPSYYPDVSSVLPAWRNTLTHFIVVESWRDGIPREAIQAVYSDITYNKTELLRKLSPETGAYFNEPDSFEPNWQKAFFGENYGRLRKIKEKYDPKNVLWCLRCVGSEALEEQLDGRLCQLRDSYHHDEKKRDHVKGSKRAGGYYLEQSKSNDNGKTINPSGDAKRWTKTDHGHKRDDPSVSFGNGAYGIYRGEPLKNLNEKDLLRRRGEGYGKTRDGKGSLGKKRGWGADFPDGFGKAESTDPDWPQKRENDQKRGQHGSLDRRRNQLRRSGNAEADAKESGWNHIIEEVGNTGFSDDN